MNYITNFAIKIIFLIILVLHFLGFFSLYKIFASESNGTIDPDNAGFKLTKICKNPACSVFGNVNWKPTVTDANQAVSITDSGLNGFIWGDEVGWINLKPTSGGVNINPQTGELSGTGFASVGAWVNFKPTSVGGEEVGVKINQNGEFSGYAFVSGINGGWMKFDCASPGMCIKTDWRPIPNRSSSSGGSGGISKITLPVRKDVKIDLAYFNSVMVHWNEKYNVNTKQDCYDSNMPDINCDGVINQTDLDIIVSNWGKYANEINL